MYLGLKGKVVVVTGGGSGIGAGITKAFLEEECKVAICGRTEFKLLNFKNQLEVLSKDLYIGVADASNYEEISIFTENVIKIFGKIDIWINNAGVEELGYLTECESEMWDRIMSINLKGAWICSKVASRYLKQIGAGSIINISSFTSICPSARSGIYAITKSGVNSMTKVMAAELAPYGIRVNGIVPGMISTPMTEEKIENKKEKLLSLISLRRLGTPEDIANGAIFLASEAASYITGEILVISGGKMLIQHPEDPWSSLNELTDNEVNYGR